MEPGDAATTMPTQRQLFGPKRPRKKRGTPAPESLTRPEIRRLEEWAELHCPWLRREALESFESVESYAEEVLEWWRGDGGLKANWVATIENRIRVVERSRLAGLAKSGNMGARHALRNASEWAREYDAREAASRRVALIAAPENLDPGGGGEIVRLGDRRGRPRR